MGNVELVREITGEFAKNADDSALLKKYFAPEFVHWANGRQSDLQGYASRLAEYRSHYEGFTVTAWDELFAAEDDRVVAAYTLAARKKGGATEQIPVIAIWRLRGGKVVSLREVDGS
jgi:ketosteroid isomerase-like protein